MIYLILFLLIVGLSKIEFLRTKKTCTTTIQEIDIKQQKKIYCIVISILLVLLLFLKHDGLGNDTGAYRKLYEDILERQTINHIIHSTYRLGSNMERGFLVLCLLGAKLNLPFRIFMLILATFYIIPMSILIYRYSEKAWLSYFIFILLGYFVFFTTLRQALALACTVISFLASGDNKKFCSYSWAILACFFHKSALIYLGWFLVKNIQWTKLKILSVFVCVGVLYYFRIPITTYFLNVVEKSNYESMGESGGYPIIFLFLAIVCVGAIYRKRVLYNSKNMMLFYTMMICTLVVLPIGKFNPFFFRIRHYFAIYIIIFVPNLFVKLKREFLAWLVVAYIMLYGFYLFTGLFLNQQATRSWPYVFYWQDYPKEIELPLSIQREGKW